MIATAAARGRASRRARWWLLALALAVLFGPAIWVELTPASRPRVVLPTLEKDSGPFRVFVADWGYHTAIVLEQPAGWRLGPPDETAARFVEYAWGDRRFYMESNFWPQAVFATLLLPTSTVTYVDGRARPPGAGARSVHVREVDASTFHILAAELEASIVRTTDGERVKAFPPATGYPGRFFPGIGRYLWSTNCNRWTVERLAAAGLAGSARGVFFSGQVPGRLRGFRPAGDSAAVARP